MNRSGPACPPPGKDSRSGGAIPMLKHDPDDIAANPDPREPVGALIERRLSRRAALLGLAGAAMLSDKLVETAQAQVSGPLPVPVQGGPSTFTFPELRHQHAQRDAV